MEHHKDVVCVDHADKIFITNGKCVNIIDIYHTIDRASAQKIIMDIKCIDKDIQYQHVYYDYLLREKNMIIIA